MIRFIKDDNNPWPSRYSRLTERAFPIEGGDVDGSGRRPAPLPAPPKKPEKEPTESLPTCLVECALNASHEVGHGYIDEASEYCIEVCELCAIIPIIENPACWACAVCAVGIGGFATYCLSDCLNKVPPNEDPDYDFPPWYGGQLKRAFTGDDLG